MTELDLSGQGLTGLPDLSAASRLEYLSLYANEITAVPDSLWTLTGLRVLNLATNRLTSLSPLISALKSVHTLDLGHNALTTLPDDLSGFASLRELRLYHNKLTALPDSIGTLSAHDAARLAGSSVQTGQIGSPVEPATPGTGLAGGVRGRRVHGPQVT